MGQLITEFIRFTAVTPFMETVRYSTSGLLLDRHLRGVFHRRDNGFTTGTQAALKFMLDVWPDRSRPTMRLGTGTFDWQSAY